MSVALLAGQDEDDDNEEDNGDYEEDEGGLEVEGDEEEDVGDDDEEDDEEYDEDEDEDYDPAGPSDIPEPDICFNPMKELTVFFCKSCKNVITDSTAVVATCKSLDMLIFNGQYSSIPHVSAIIRASQQPNN